MSKYQVISIGGATRDIMFYTDQGIVIKNPEDLTRQKLLGFEYGAKILSENAIFTLGGGGCNTAVALSRLGLKVANFVIVGKDREGDAVLKDLKEEGVAVSFVAVTPKESTGFSFIAVDEKTQEHVAFLFRGANNLLKVGLEKLKSGNPSWLYVSSLTGKTWKENSRNILKFLKLTDTKLTWNPGETQLSEGYKTLAPLIRETDVLILNKDEAIEFIITAKKKVRGINNPKILVKTIYHLGPKVALVTCGRKGAYAFDGSKIYYTPIKSVPVKDTTGAGDCFGSSFIAGLIKFKGNINKALRLGILNTASLVQVVGAQGGLAYWRDLKNKI